MRTLRFESVQLLLQGFQSLQIDELLTFETGYLLFIALNNFILKGKLVNGWVMERIRQAMENTPSPILE